MKVSDPIKRAVPFCLCLCILCCLLPAIAAISGSTASIKLCILSDLHYLAAAGQAENHFSWRPPNKRRQMETSGGYMARAHRQRKKRLRL